MERLIYIILIFCLFGSCSDNDGDIFEVAMPQKIADFEPRPGGAMMRYYLPTDSEVQAIHIRYRDFRGKEVHLTGSYACDSLEIIGFNEAQRGVPASVTISNRANVESDPVEVTFDTQDSGPVAFFQDVKVESGWNGFNVSYQVPESVKGLAHVFYLGKNPLTNEPDTILLTSFQIQKGGDTLSFPLKQFNETNTVVIRTEDFRGYMVKEQTWENIAAYKMAQLGRENFDVYDPEGLSIEDDEEGKVGIEYLFDGSTKGEKTFGERSRTTFHTYLAGPQVAGKTLFILDFKEAREIAAVRLYAWLNVQRSALQSDKKTFYGAIWRGQYQNRLPCDVTLYASNDKDNESSWKEIGHFKQSKDLDMSIRWCSKTHGYGGGTISSLSSLEAADAQYMSFDFPPGSESYRYVKVVVNELFNHMYPSYTNEGGYVTLEECEVYTKED